jgi:hypothetical protein
MVKVVAGQAFLASGLSGHQLQSVPADKRVNDLPLAKLEARRTGTALSLLSSDLDRILYLWRGGCWASSASSDVTSHLKACDVVLWEKKKRRSFWKKKKKRRSGKKQLNKREE